METLIEQGEEINELITIDGIDLNPFMDLSYSLCRILEVSLPIL